VSRGVSKLERERYVLGGFADLRFVTQSTERRQERGKIIPLVEANREMPENQRLDQTFRDQDGKPLQRLRGGLRRRPYLGAGRRRFLSPAERARLQSPIANSIDAQGPGRQLAFARAAQG
jgi:hypothetical protein